jgi:hypothetical protein
MPRFIRKAALATALLAAAAATRAEDAPRFANERQEQAYNQRKLSVEVSVQGIGSYGGGAVNYAEWRRWTGYQGFTPIEEERFFRIAGYEAEAVQAAAFHRTGRRLWLGGLVASGVGLAAMFIGLAADDNVLLLGGGAIAVGGTLPMYMSIGYRKGNWAPYSTVDGIAREHNKRVVLQIRKEF